MSSQQQRPILGDTEVNTSQDWFTFNDTGHLKSTG